MKTDLTIEPMLPETRSSLRRQSPRAARYFERFEKRFAGFRPAVIDRFFVAHPADSCVAVGWDFRELDGLTEAEAERIFALGMEEFESMLRDCTEGCWLESPVGFCQDDNRETEVCDA